MKRNLISILIIFFCLIAFSQQGYILTTLKEDNISRIGVNILYRLDNSPLDIDSSKVPGDSFFIECADEKVKFIPGMSGSPLYYDDRMIGVLSYVFGTSGKFGVCTRIENIKNQDEYFITSNINATTKRAFFTTGGSEAADRLSQSLKTNVVSVPDIDFSMESSGGELKPGSAVIVSLVRGDTNIGMLGTLSLIHQNRFYAFGHPVFDLGKVNYFLSKAFILGCDFENGAGFKIGIPQKTLGKVEYDGKSGINGELGKFPLTIPFFIEYIDSDKEKDFRYRVIKDERILLKVADSLIYASSEEIFHRSCVAPVSFDLSMNVSFEEGESFNISFKDKKLLPDIDLRSELSSMVYDVISLLIKNPFRKITVNSIDLKVKILESERFIPDEISFNDDRINIDGLLFRKGKAVIDIPLQFEEGIANIKVKTPVLDESGRYDELEQMIFKIEEWAYDLIISVEYNNGVANDYHIRTKYIIDGDIDEVIYPEPDNKDT